MKNEKILKSEEIIECPKSKKVYYIYIADGIITFICIRIIEDDSKDSYSPTSCYFDPNKDLFSFQRTLYEIVNMWKKQKSNTYKELLDSLCDTEKEKYFSKYSNAISFSCGGSYPECRHKKITINILNSKIFSITHSISYYTDTISNDSLDNKLSDVCNYLYDFIYFLLSGHDIDIYYDFLNSLCDEEKEKYFQPSYLPKKL